MNFKGLRAFTRIMATGTLNAAHTIYRISRKASVRQVCPSDEHAFTACTKFH